MAQMFFVTSFSTVHVSSSSASPCPTFSLPCKGHVPKTASFASSQGNADQFTALQVRTVAWTLLALYAITVTCHAVNSSRAGSKPAPELISCRQETDDLEHQVFGLQKQLRSSQGNCQSLQEQLRQALSSLRCLQVCWSITSGQLSLSV